jgi:hypothetical protein
MNTKIKPTSLSFWLLALAIPKTFLIFEVICVVSMIDKLLLSHFNNPKNISIIILQFK